MMEHQQLEFNVTRVVRHPSAGSEGTAHDVASLEGGLVREVVISTEKPVRSGGGIARATGAVLAPYLRNPVVMWAHNYREPPVAKCSALQVEPGVGISAKFEFPAPGVYPLADVVRGLWDGGFINAASIGFSPLEWEMVADPEQPAPPPGRQAEQMPVFTRWELYEFSLVSVPRDREAVRRALEVNAECGMMNAECVEAEAPVVAAGSLSALDLQRLLDGLRAVRGAYHA
jgi:hypothetical protein